MIIIHHLIQKKPFIIKKNFIIYYLLFSFFIHFQLITLSFVSLISQNQLINPTNLYFISIEYYLLYLKMLFQSFQLRNLDKQLLVHYDPHQK